MLTIRRQIAKRRRSEIIRNLQLTGAGAGPGHDADGAGRPGTWRGRRRPDGRTDVGRAGGLARGRLTQYPPAT